MISTRAVALTAVGASFTALFVMLLYVPALIVKVGEINDQVQTDSDEFKVMVDEAWSEMIRSRKSNRAHLRPRRQSYEGVNKGYGSSGGGDYAKPDVSNGPTCCEFWRYST